MKRKFLIALFSAAVILAAGALAACATNESKPHDQHSWDGGEITSPASCGSRGLMTYTCTECGEIKSEIIPQLEHAHSEEWLKNADEHWHAATCQHTGERVGVSAHEWGEGEVVSAATCLKTGRKKFTCVCGETKVEVIEKTEHAFAEAFGKDGEKHWRVCTTEGCTAITDEHAHNWDNGEITTPATCQAEGVKTFTCTDCGDTKTEPIALSGHAYAEKMSYDEEGNGHWRACATEGCNAITDEGAHTYGEWATEGRLYRPCTQCAYEQFSPALTSGEGYNNVTVTVGGGIKCAINVFSMGFAYYTISYSGVTPINVVFEYYDREGEFISREYVLSPENTSFTEKLPDRSIACMFIESQAETAFECQLSLSISSTAPKHTHNFSSEWSKSETEHWHACTGSGCEEAADVAVHEWDGFFCTVCGYDMREADN